MEKERFYLQHENKLLADVKLGLLVRVDVHQMILGGNEVDPADS